MKVMILASITTRKRRVRVNKVIALDLVDQVVMIVMENHQSDGKEIHQIHRTLIQLIRPQLSKQS